MDINEAIEQGIRAGKAERTKKQRDLSDHPLPVEGKLKDIYNSAAAQELFKGLEVIEKRSGEKFIFKVKGFDSVDGPVLHVATNIPTQGGSLLISINDHGKISAIGDITSSGLLSTTVESVHSVHGKVAPVLTFVAKKAAAKGLVR